jgi:hypothetical protein
MTVYTYLLDKRIFKILYFSRSEDAYCLFVCLIDGV